jgi:hypothetical protein
MLASVVCVAGADNAQAYVAVLQVVGFSRFSLEDCSEALLPLVNDVRRTLVGVQLAAALARRNGRVGAAEMLEG